MQSSKVIDVSQASLVSLKAELSRKQEEVGKAKLEAKASCIRPLPKPKKETEKPAKSSTVVEDPEERQEYEQLLQKSRNCLEEKAKLYDKLSSAQGPKIDEDSGYLVDFEQKSAELQKSNEESQSKNEEEVEDNGDAIDGDDDDDDWVEFTDCLGRTRKCLKEDLEFMKERDQNLSKSLGFYVDKEGQKITDESLEPNPPAPSHVDVNDARREELRRKWEEEEELLKDKKDIHYQDVLFDEARTHGVGYFAFARDEEARRQQQASLAAARDETRRRQVAAGEARARRAAAMAQRLKAARARRRRRLGLPPEEEEEEGDAPGPPAPPVNPIEEEAAKQAAIEEADRKAKEQEEKRKAQILRPWDEGKTKKPFQEMSQEEWVKKKRSERNPDFAPPSAYGRTSSREYNKAQKRKYEVEDDDYIDDDDDDSVIEVGPMPPPPPARETVWERPEDVEPDYSALYSQAGTSSKFSAYQTSKKLRKIINEVSDEEPAPPEDRRREGRGSGVEIAPPASCEYYGLPPIPRVQRGPVAGKRMEEIEQSISLGLKYLREQQEAKNKKQDKGLLDII